jgi:hypothetical protein
MSHQILQPDPAAIRLLPQKSHARSALPEKNLGWCPCGEPVLDSVLDGSITRVWITGRGSVDDDQGGTASFPCKRISPRKYRQCFIHRARMEVDFQGCQIILYACKSHINKSVQG